MIYAILSFEVLNALIYVYIYFFCFAAIYFEIAIDFDVHLSLII